MGKRGPKLTQVDWKMLTKMAAIQCTGEEMASLLDIDYDTLQRACKRDHGIKFADWIGQKRLGGRSSLRKLQYNSAQGGNITMQIWLGKNWLGQTDKLPDDHNDEVDALIKAFAALSGKVPV